MSSTVIIVKRRPSRPQAHSEAPAAAEVAPHCDHRDDDAAAPDETHHTTFDYTNDVYSEHAYHADPEEEDDEQEQDVPHRPTCTPSSAVPHPYPQPEPGTEEEDECELPAEDVDVEYDEPAAAEEEEAENEEEPTAAAAPPPPPQVKTARPKETKPKKAHKASAAKKVAKSTPAAATAKPSAAAAARNKKKPTHKVSLSNVESQPPVPEGVNTPRSIAVCEKHGVNPTELACYPKTHFMGPGVVEEVAELRYHSYEKRREARMAELMPAYRAYVKKHPAAPPRPKAASPEAAAAAASESEQDQEASQRPTQQPTDEEVMQRQFEEQHQRLLEQERRKASGANSACDNDGRRRSSPRAGGQTTSPGRYSVSTATGGRPTVDQPYSAIKIYSQSITEERTLTQSEAVVIEDINEREARRLDTQERAAIIQENKQLMHVEQGLEKERRASTIVRSKAQERERRQQEQFKHSQDRRKEAAARRERIEEERMARLQEYIAEKEGRVHATDIYASLLSRRRHSGSSSTRRGSRNIQSGEEPQVPQEADAEEL